MYMPKIVTEKHIIFKETNDLKIRWYKQITRKHGEKNRIGEKGKV